MTRTRKRAKSAAVYDEGSEREYNFDGLVGPTHNYGGLSPGNVASLSHKDVPSNPKAAALQGLDKMAFVLGLGVGQALLPPHARPALKTLHALGFRGPDEAVLAEVAKHHWHLYRLVSSASAMWTANAATMAPASDTTDSRLHLVPANLQSMFHRSIEGDETYTLLMRIFADEEWFQVHQPLPGGGQFSDEGAANHTRLQTSAAALHLFAYGRKQWGDDQPGPTKYPARQSLEASQAVARLLTLRDEQTLFARQNPAGIDAGSFHTDVLAVGHGRFFMAHEWAFSEQAMVLAKLRAKLGAELEVIVANESELPATVAVKAYPFNSQVVTLPGGKLCIVAPLDSQETPEAKRFLERVVAESKLVKQVHYLDVRQSMHNGGGPACLRQRIVISDEARKHIKARVFVDAGLLAELRQWVNKHYRDRLTNEELADPELHRQQMAALDDLTEILKLGSVYDFQSATPHLSPT